MSYKLIFLSLFLFQNLSAITVSDMIKECASKKKSCKYSKIKNNKKRILHVPNGRGKYLQFIVDTQDLRGSNIPLFQKTQNLIPSPASAIKNKNKIETRKDHHPPLVVRPQKISKSKKRKTINPHPPLVVRPSHFASVAKKESINHHQILSSISSEEERDLIYNDYKLYENLDFNRNDRLDEQQIKRVLFNHFLYLNYQTKHFKKDPSEKKKQEEKIAYLIQSQDSLEGEFYKEYKKHSETNKRFAYYQKLGPLGSDEKKEYSTAGLSFPEKNKPEPSRLLNKLLSNISSIFQKDPKAMRQLPRIPHAADLNQEMIIRSLKNNIPQIASAQNVAEKSNTEASDCVDCEQNKGKLNEENKNFKDQFYQCFDDEKNEKKLCSFQSTNAAFYEGKHECYRHLRKINCAKGCFANMRDPSLNKDEKAEEFHKLVDDFYVDNKKAPSLGARLISCIATEKENKKGLLGLRTLISCGTDHKQRLARKEKNFTAIGLFQITKPTLKEVFENEGFWNALEDLSPARGYVSSGKFSFNNQRDRYLNDPFIQVKAAEAVLFEKMTYLFKGGDRQRTMCVEKFATNEYVKYLSLQLYYGSENKKSNQSYARPIYSCSQKQKKFNSDSLKHAKNQFLNKAKNLKGKGCFLRENTLKQVDFL